MTLCLVSFLKLYSLALAGKLTISPHCTHSHTHSLTGREEKRCQLPSKQSECLPPFRVQCVGLDLCLVQHVVCAHQVHPAVRVGETIRVLGCQFGSFQDCKDRAAPQDKAQLVFTVSLGTIDLYEWIDRKLSGLASPPKHARSGCICTASFVAIAR